MKKEKELMAYQVVSTINSEAFAGMVTAQILEGGWQPYGSPTFTPEGMCYQAMVRYEENLGA